MVKVRNYVNGEWQESSSGKTLYSIDPATQEIVAEAPDSTVDDMEQAILTARQVFDRGEWASQSGVEKAGILLKIGQKLRERVDELAHLMTLENGRPLKSTKGEVLRCAEIVEYFAAQARTFHGSNNLTLPNVLSLVSYEPVGVCGLIVPWNFPLDLAIRKIAPALATGCTVILKPSMLVPAVTMALVTLIDEIRELPRGVFNCVNGNGPDIGNALVVSPHVNKISFTGATTTGENILRAAANTMKRVSLECGGKSPSIVFEDAPMEKAIQGALWGTFYNTGQSCSSKARVLVHASIHESLVSELKDRIRAIRVGPGLNATSEIGPLVSQTQLEKVVSYIDIGLAEGAKLVAGGHRLKGTEFDRGFFIEPTIFDRVDPQAAIAQHEIFGPVLSIIPFETEEEAITIANATPFGLSSSIWTRDVNRAFRVARRIRAGEVMVNTNGLRIPEGPFGGYGKSGIGRELGSDGLLEYTEVKHTLVDLN